MTTVDRTRLGRASAALSIGIAVVALLVQVVEGTLGLIDEGNFSLHFAVVAVGFGALVWIALPSQPGNGVLWALAGSALAAAIALIGIVLIVIFAPDDVSSYRELVGRSPS
ncbi:MAG: hypothetical protein HKN74_04575, partial [Acidimicrobiia bacterium]|nr:hypothetical protein [Acidimicrobiia bacterium]